LDGKPFEGLTVRLFDPQTRLWTIDWADSNAMTLDGGKRCGRRVPRRYVKSR
jgi:hypothetical protein